MASEFQKFIHPPYCRCHFSLSQRFFLPPFKFASPGSFNLCQLGEKFLEILYSARKLINSFLIKLGSFSWRSVFALRGLESFSKHDQMFLYYTGILITV